MGDRRKWRPDTTYTYRAPEARYNDRVGPVDDEYTLEIDANGFIAPSIRHASPDIADALQADMKTALAAGQGEAAAASD